MAGSSTPTGKHQRCLSNATPETRASCAGSRSRGNGLALTPARQTPTLPATLLVPGISLVTPQGGEPGQENKTPRDKARFLLKIFNFSKGERKTERVGPTKHHIFREMSRNSLMSLPLCAAQKRTHVSSGFAVALPHVGAAVKGTPIIAGRGSSTCCCGPEQHPAGSGSEADTSTSSSAVPRHSLQPASEGRSCSLHQSPPWSVAHLARSHIPAPAPLWGRQVPAHRSAEDPV